MLNGLRWKIAQSFEKRWWRNYLKNKEVSDYLAWKKNYWHNFLTSISPYITLLPNHQVLDAGCGPAGIFMLFPNQPCTAIDPLLSSYETLPHFSKKNYPNTNFIAAALEDFSSENSFHISFCINAINHVSNLQKSFQQLTNATKPNGHLVISIDAHNHNWLKRIFQLLPGDILHPHQYNIDEYVAMIISTGCTHTKTITVKKDFIFSYYIVIAQKKE